METVALSLVSHTNVGKTTLARTLLRRDVGSVFDQAHVTEVSEGWPLLEVEGGQLVLWDTPGFGDTVRLLRRLRSSSNPVGWFLHQVWDRMRDRPLWCSQEAVRNIREDADVVLYLVNAAEDPEDAGYVRHELDLLAWIDCPVLLLLNQAGPGQEAAELERRWREYTGSWPQVRDVLSLDAFTRCWVQEGALLDAVAAVLPEDRRPLMERLMAAWDERNLGVFGESVAALATLLDATAPDSEPLPAAVAGRRDRQRAMDALAGRLEARSRDLMTTLLELHGLDGEAAAEVLEKTEDFVVKGSAPFSTRAGAIWGGLVSGAASGVAADLLVGGLSFGGGAVVGAVVGALGGAGLAQGILTVGGRDQPAVGWTPDFLTQLLRQALLRYLAVAQFGRGRGALRDDPLDQNEAAVEAWRAAVDEALASRAGELTSLWKGRAAGSGAGREAIARLVDQVLRAVLVGRYPEAAARLG